MKMIVLCLMLVSPLMVNLSVAEEKVTFAEEVSGVAKEVQKELQGIYLKLRDVDKVKGSVANSPQKKLMTELEVYNRKMHSLYLETGGNTDLSYERWEDLNEALERVRGLTASGSVFSDNVLKARFGVWIKKAQSLGATSEKYAVRAKRTSPQAIAANVGGYVHGGTGLVVEDYSLGLNTPQDRIDFVERLTRLRAAENQIFSRGVYTTPGYPRNYPAAWIYGNGSYGNLSPYGRRDTLTPLYGNTRQPVRRRTTPAVQIIIR